VSVISIVDCNCSGGGRSRIRLFDTDVLMSFEVSGDADTGRLPLAAAAPSNATFV